MRLFHFSDDPGIEVFVPRAPVHRPGIEPLVWAVDENHAGAYLFPRDCPRVLLWPTAETTSADRERWWGTRAETVMIAHVEWEWYERLHTALLFRYELPVETFVPLEDDTWMWVSRETVRPREMEPITDILAAMRAQRIELRLMSSLAPLWGACDSTVHFSGIRLGNAVTWPKAEPSAPPAAPE